MSLTSNLNQKTPIGLFLLDLVKVPQLPNLARQEPVVRHNANRWSLIGTAFDYLVRMSIAKETGITFEPDIAEIAIEQYFWTQDPFECEQPHHPDSGKTSSDLTEEVSGDCNCNICRHKRNYLKCKLATEVSINENDISSMAQSSLSFSRLDPYMRARYWDEDWFARNTDEADVEELVMLHDLWKSSFLLPDGELLLNPSFNYSGLVGGADADIIAGQTIIDWKVVNAPNRDFKKHIAQMIGYALLSHLEGRKISICTIYYARHGVQFSIPFSDIMGLNFEKSIKAFKEISGFDEFKKKREKRLLEREKRKRKLRTASGESESDRYWRKRQENRCVAKAKTGDQCAQLRKKGFETCHIHTPLVVEEISIEEEQRLIEKIRQTPSIPKSGYWMSSRYGSTKYPTKTGWKKWCRKFPKNHPMFKKQDNQYPGTQSDIAGTLINYCATSMNSVNAFLMKNDVLLSDYKTKWEKFWKVHEIVSEREG